MIADKNVQSPTGASTQDKIRDEINRQRIRQRVESALRAEAAAKKLCLEAIEAAERAYNAELAAAVASATKLRKAAEKLAREAQAEAAWISETYGNAHANYKEDTWQEDIWQDTQDRNTRHFARQAAQASKGREQFFSVCDYFFTDTKGFPFPIPPSAQVICEQTKCTRGTKLNVCHHEIKDLFQGRDLLKEILRWHPDRFPGQIEVQKLASEMFQLLQRVIGDAQL
jgi:hypothetical protein